MEVRGGPRLVLVVGGRRELKTMRPEYWRCLLTQMEKVITEGVRGHNDEDRCKLGTWLGTW